MGFIWAETWAGDGRTAVRAASSLLAAALLCTGCAVKGVLGDGIVGAGTASGASGAGSTTGASAGSTSGTGAGSTTGTGAGATSSPAATSTSGSGSGGSSSSGGTTGACAAPVATSAPDLPIDAAVLALATNALGTALVYGVLGADQITTTFYLQQLSAAGATVGGPTQLGSNTPLAGNGDITTLSMVAAGDAFLVCWDAANIGLTCVEADLAGDVTPGFTAAGSAAVAATGPGGQWVFFEGDGGIVGQPLTSQAQAAPGSITLATSAVSSASSSYVPLAATGVDGGYAVFWLGDSNSAVLWWLDPRGATLGQTPVSFGSGGLPTQLALAATGNSVLLAYLDYNDNVLAYTQAGVSAPLLGPEEVAFQSQGVSANGLAIAGAPGSFATVWPDPALTYQALADNGRALGPSVAPSQPGDSATPVALTAVPGGFLAAAAGIEFASGNYAIFITSFRCQ
ncbi:MAG: hypothetical protein ACYDCL_23300 [Myxococcales bacterium]